MKNTILPVVMLIFFFSTPSFAADWHVRANGGSYGVEDGTDWANAFDGFSDISWGSINPGDTVYIAGGIYTQVLSPTASGSNGSPIIIKRATVQDHGSTTGWDNTLDMVINHNTTGKAMDLGGSKNLTYVTVDGTTTDGWSIKWGGGGEGSAAISVDVSSGNTASNLKFTNIRIDGVNNTTSSRGMYLDGSGHANGDFVHYLTLDNLSFYNNTDDPIFIRGQRNLTIQNCRFKWRNRLDGAHGDALEVWQGNADVIVRWNTFVWDGQNIFFNGYSGDNSGNGQWDIHNNIFYNDGTWTNGTAQITIKTQSWNPVLQGPINFFNNTIVNYERLGSMKSNSNAYMYNNLSYGNDGGGASLQWGSGVTNDYNYYESGRSISETNGVVGGDPFVNYTAYDFNLHSSSTAIGAGTNLGENYGADYYGNLRNSVGAWDLGAVKFTNSGDGIAPMPPMQLDISVSN